MSQENCEILLLKGDFDKIIENTQQLSSIEDFYWNSIALDHKGKVLEALKVLSDGIIMYEEIEKLELLYANYLFKTGQYPKAKLYLLKYKDNNLFNKLISVLEFENNYQLAIDLIEKEISSDSTNVYLLSHLAENYYQIDSLNLAIYWYEKALIINQNDQLIIEKLAKYYFKDKAYRISVQKCDIALQNDSLNKNFIKIKGMASMNIPNYETAQNCFKFLYENGDSSNFILKNLGVCEFNNSSFVSSRDHLLLAFQFDPNDYEICYFLGKGYLNSPYPEKGLFYFNRVDSLLQPDLNILSALYLEKQSIYNSINKYEEALNCYKIAHKYNPKPEYLFYIASMYETNFKNSEKALEYYNLFLQKLPTKLNSDHKYKEDQMILSLRKSAENNIVRLKEELFFKGEF